MCMRADRRCGFALFITGLAHLTSINLFIWLRERPILRLDVNPPVKIEAPSPPQVLPVAPRPPRPPSCSRSCAVSHHAALRAELRCPLSHPLCVYFGRVSAITLTLLFRLNLCSSVQSSAGRSSILWGRSNEGGHIYAVFCMDVCVWIHRRYKTLNSNMKCISVIHAFGHVSRALFHDVVVILR